MTGGGGVHSEVLASAPVMREKTHQGCYTQWPPVHRRNGSEALPAGSSHARHSVSKHV